MGGVFSRIFSRLWSEREYRILILGLDGAGKTTVLYRMQTGECVSTTPTIGFNVETLKIQNVKFQVWDLGGQTSIRPYWRCYYTNTNAIVYIIDSSDKDRLDISGGELSMLLQEKEIKGVPLLIIANKADIEHSASTVSISDSLKLTEIKDRQWTICRCSALTGEGLTQAFDWLIERVQKNTSC